MTTPEKDTGGESEVLEETSLISHLVELRDRVIRATLALIAVLLCLVPFAQQIFTFVAKPLIAVMPKGSQMIATQVASPFLTPFKTTFWVALFLAMPAIIYQVWAFIAPGLYKKEKRFVIPLVVSSIILFYCGIAFAYWIVFPLMFAFFTTVAPEGVTMMTDINSYLDFVLSIFFAFGLVFEVPIATVVLVWSGIVKLETLTSNRSYVFLGAFVVGMFITPPDVISQTLVAIPMYMLYEAGIVMARILLPATATPAESAAAVSSKSDT